MMLCDDCKAAADENCEGCHEECRRRENWSGSKCACQHYPVGSLVRPEEA